jgi:hypothetical protein
VIHHTVNRHEWQIGGGVSAGQCSHGPLEEDHDKAWLEQGSPAHKALVEIVLNVRFLNNIHHYVNFRCVNSLSYAVYTTVSLFIKHIIHMSHL